MKSCVTKIWDRNLFVSAGAVQQIYDFNFFKS